MSRAGLGVGLDQLVTEPTMIKDVRRRVAAQQFWHAISFVTRNEVYLTLGAPGRREPEVLRGDYTGSLPSQR